MGSVGHTATRTQLRLVRWGDARAALDEAMGKLRQRIEIEIPDEREHIIKDIPNADLVRAVAFERILEWWYAGACVLNVLRLPKKQRNRSKHFTRAHTVNPEGKIPLRRSRKRLIERLGKAQARRHGKTTHHARRRSHHVGTYSKLKAGPGRPTKHRTKDQAKHAHALSQRRYWRSLGKRRAYAPRRSAKDVKRMKEWKKTHAAAWKAALVDWQALPKKHHADTRHNHRLEMGYQVPHPRLRRTGEQVERWGHRKDTTKKEQAARRAFVASAKSKRTLLIVVRKTASLAGYGERKKEAALHAGYKRFKEFMNAKIAIAMGTAHGRKWGSRNRKKKGRKASI